MQRFIIFLCLHCLTALILQGQSLHVQTISIIGNEKTKPYIILRELTFQEGDSLKTAELEALFERNRQNVYNLGLFNKVEFKTEKLDGNLYVFIDVRERWYIFPVPHLRFEERNTYDLLQALSDGNFERLVYGLQLQWRNVSGRNETLGFYGQLGYSQRLNIGFARPFIFPRQRIDLFSGLHYKNVKEIIYGTLDGRIQRALLETESLQRSIRSFVGLRKRFTPFESLYMELNYQHYRFSDSLYAFQLNDEPSNFIPSTTGLARYPSLVLQYSKDMRDFKSFPLSGWKYQVMFRVAGIPDNRQDNTNFAKLGMTWAQFLPLSKKWNFSYGTQNIVSFGRRIPFFEKSTIGIFRREFFGISSTLRGYEPYAIDGTFTHMSKAEIKFALLPRRIFHLKEIPFKRFQDFPLGIYLTAFYDGGYVKDDAFNNQDLFFKDRWLSGYGVGLNIISFYDRLFRVEFTRNHLGQNGVYIHSVLSIK